MLLLEVLEQAGCVPLQSSWLLVWCCRGWHQGGRPACCCVSKTAARRRRCASPAPLGNHISAHALHPRLVFLHRPTRTQSLCDLALRFGEDDEGEGGMSRPFGVALLVAGWDAENGPAL